MENQEKLEQLIKDRGFMEKLNSCADASGLKELFSEHGFNLSSAEADELKKQLDSAAGHKAEGEISDDALDEAAGGNVISDAIHVYNILKNVVLPFFKK